MEPRLRVAGFVTLVAVFMAFLDVTVVNVAFPSVRRSFPDTSLAGLSWVLNAYSIVFAALLVPMGRLADVVGARRVFVLALALFVAASAVCAAAPAVEALVAARVFQAAGAAALVPAAQSLLMAAVPVERRGSAIAAMAAVGAFAAGIGPPLAGLLVEASSWRLAFLINVPLGLVALVAARALPAEAGRGGHRPDLLGAAVVALATGCLALGLVQGEWWGWSDARVVAAFVAAAVLVPAFFLRSARHPAPVVELRLLRVRGFAFGNGATLVLGISFYALLLGNALFLTSVWGWSVLEAGLAMAPTPIAAAIVAPLGGAVADRGHPLLVIGAGAAVLAAGGWWFATQVPATPDLWAAWIPGAVITGVGLGLAYATAASVTVASLDAALFGVGSGVNAMMRQLGAVLGVALLVSLLGRPGPAEAPAAFDRGWWLAAAGAVVALGLTVGFGRGRGVD